MLWEKQYSTNLRGLKIPFHSYAYQLLAFLPLATGKQQQKENHLPEEQLSVVYVNI